MAHDRKVVLPLHLNMGHRRIFTIKTSTVNEKISPDAEFAEIDEVKIKRLENDEDLNQVIVNKGLPGQLSFNYNDTGISIDRVDAQRAAAVFNRSAREKVAKTIEIEKRRLEGLMELLRFYDEELPKTNLI